jgi:ectoine hydroxylase-related dioxygenase (phytanoyl-CoA dioxygenase family)
MPKPLPPPTPTVTLRELTTDFAHCASVFDRWGCVVVDDALQSAAMLDELEVAAKRVRSVVQGGEGRYSLEVAKNAPGATQLNALIAPEVSEPIFQHMMGCDAIARYADRLIGWPEIRFWFCAMWCLQGRGTPEYDTGWHRDTSGILGTSWYEQVGRQRELAILDASPEQVGRCLKWTTCLIEGGDPCLFVCPGSHRRFRSCAESRGLTAAGCKQPIQEGEVQITLRRGQTCFWAGTLIHRGWQPPGCVERLSMTCGLQAHGHPSVPLTHPWPWCRAPNIRPSLLSPRMRGYWDLWHEAVRALDEQEPQPPPPPPPRQLPAKL